MDESPHERLGAELALYQYWLFADSVLEQYRAHALKDSEATPIRSAFFGIPPDDMHARWRWLRLWCGTLYTVIEGWEKLELSDAKVDRTITDLRRHGELTDLRRFRNCVFHFQADLMDDRFGMVLFVGWAAGFVRRIQTLHEQLGRYFARWKADTDFGSFRGVSSQGHG